VVDVVTVVDGAVGVTGSLPAGLPHAAINNSSTTSLFMMCSFPELDPVHNPRQ